MTQPEASTGSAQELEWIQMRRDFDADRQGIETTKEKFLRKFKSNPLVPVGCLATAGALSFGLWSFRRGEERMSQMMMRARILAQGFTVVALIAGVGFSLTEGMKSKEKKEE